MLKFREIKQKDKIKFGISAVLVILLLLAIINSGKAIRRAGRRRKKILYEQVSGPGILAQKPIRQDAWLYKRLEEETKDLALQRDPFTLTRITKTKDSPSGLALTGIVWDEQAPRAIINDRIVGVADTVGSDIIIEIEPDRVILTGNSGDFELILK